VDFQILLICQLIFALRVTLLTEDIDYSIRNLNHLFFVKTHLYHILSVAEVERHNGYDHHMHVTHREFQSKKTFIMPFFMVFYASIDIKRAPLRHVIA